MGEKPTVLVECSHEICVKVNEAYVKSPPDIRDMLEKMGKLLRSNIKFSVEDLASELGIGRATVFWRLNKIGIKFNELVEAIKVEYEEKTQKKLKVREKKALPPKTYEEFLERDKVKSVLSVLKTANLTEKYVNKVLRLWFRICRDKALAPEDFEVDNEELQTKVVEWLNEKTSNGYNKNALISQLQALQKWLGIRLLPKGIEQSEYKGKYTTAEIPLSVRDKLVLELLEKGEINMIKAFMFLYYTGSRSEALKTFTVEGKMKLEHPDLIRVFNTSEFIVVKTLEKGKKGRKFEWRKLIPSYYEFLIPPKFTDKELNKMRVRFRALLENYVNELNEDSKAYVYDAKKSLHIWRHTSAREYLRAFRFNRYLVSKMLGWDKSDNLRIYGDYGLLELLQVSSEEHKIQFVSESVFEKLKQYVKA